MNINITYCEEEHTIFLYNFQYWNQRFFCLGQSQDGSIFKKFISTKGFDQLLMESTTGPQFKFKKEHFNPYLCSREKDLWKESQQIDHLADKLEIKDIGPHEYSGCYRVVAELGSYKDNAYFETKVFEQPEFDLFMYQNDDLYYIQHQSLRKDREPQLISLMDTDLYGKVNIIHGVNEDGDDLFDVESLMKIIDNDLAYPEKNGLVVLIKSVKRSELCHFTTFGTQQFYKAKTLDFLQEDCGNSYLQNTILHKKLKRKHSLRHLYEYYQLTNQLISSRRKVSTPSISGPKEFKQNEFILHFDIQDTSNFKIIYYNDIFTIERKQSLSQLVPAMPNFAINGRYDFGNSVLCYDDFSCTKHLLEYVRDSISVSQSIKLAKLIGQWLTVTQGFAPRISKLHMAKKANSQPLVDNLTFYHIPTMDSEGDFYESETYVNTYEFFANFGLHIPAIRNVLQMNWFTPSMFRLLQTKFPLYHVCRDVRRGIFNFDDDIDMKQLMLHISDALRLINLLESAGDKKNTYWYNNGNTVLTAFPTQLIQPPTLTPGG